MYENDKMSDLAQVWLEEKLSDPNLTIKKFLLKQYLNAHRGDGKTEQEKIYAYYAQFEEWEKQNSAYMERLEKYSNNLQLEEWQASEMLNNVILEYDMTAQEQYRYLLNVRLLCIYQLANINATNCSELRKKIEQEYETKWEASEDYISEMELQNLFRQTIETMRYAGLCYTDCTRLILAKIGIGQEADFSGQKSIFLQEDLRMLTNFMVSEMILGEESEKYSAEEQEIIVNHVVPISVSSAIAGLDQRRQEQANQLAKTLLADLGSPNNEKILLLSAAVLLAARITFSVFSFWGVGVTITVGAKYVWKLCKNERTAYEKIKAIFPDSSLENKTFVKTNEKNSFVQNKEGQEVLNYIES